MDKRYLTCRKARVSRDFLFLNKDRLTNKWAFDCCPAVAAEYYGRVTKKIESSLYESGDNFFEDLHELSREARKLYEMREISTAQQNMIESRVACTIKAFDHLDNDIDGTVITTQLFKQPIDASLNSNNIAFDTYVILKSVYEHGVKLGRLLAAGDGFALKERLQYNQSQEEIKADLQMSSSSSTSTSTLSDVAPNVNGYRNPRSGSLHETEKCVGKKDKGSNNVKVDKQDQGDDIGRPAPSKSSRSPETKKRKISDETLDDYRANGDNNDDDNNDDSRNDDLTLIDHTERYPPHMKEDKRNKRSVHSKPCKPTTVHARGSHSKQSIAEIGNAKSSSSSLSTLGLGNAASANNGSRRVVGVTYLCDGHYIACARISGRLVSLGEHEDEETAARAHDLAILRAIGPENVLEKSIDLNNPIESYATEPLQAFADWDPVLKKQLTYSGWGGGKPCDFSFLLRK